MLPLWDPARIIRRMPFNLALVGGRRQGKSSACSHLVAMMKTKFDLVIAFIGSAAANPVLYQLMIEHWDPRFFFSRWNTKLVDCLLKQQEDAGPDKRSILILVDDVILNGPAEEQLAHLTMRGRHFGISLMMCAVSYTTLPKKARRSLDALLVYSCPMQGDLKVLTWEYASHQSMAEHALRNLDEHCCLVMETLEKKQQLFLWKADLLTVVEKPALPGHGKSQTEPSCEIQRERHTADDQIGNAFSQNYTQSAEYERGTALRTRAV